LVNFNDSIFSKIKNEFNKKTPISGLRYFLKKKKPSDVDEFSPNLTKKAGRRFQKKRRKENLTSFQHQEKWHHHSHFRSHRHQGSHSMTKAFAWNQAAVTKEISQASRLLQLIKATLLCCEVQPPGDRRCKRE
jgi:hypothetical protein